MGVTTEQLIALAKEGADLTNVADYVTDAQWVSWLNEGAKELHRLVTNKFKATYYRTFDFTFGDGDYQQTLPSDFWKLRGLTLNPDSIQRRRVRSYNFPEGDDGQWTRSTILWPSAYCTDRGYNVLGSRKLQLEPREHVAGVYRLFYVPKPKALALARAIVLDSDVDHVDADGGPNGSPLWSLANFGLTSADIGNLLTVSGAEEPLNNGARTIETVVSSTEAETDGVATDEDFTGMSATVSVCLDDELESFSEYVWLCAAIKSLTKEESYAQAKALADQRNLIRNDLTEALEQDSGGPATIIDTDDDRGGW